MFLLVIYGKIYSVVRNLRHILRHTSHITGVKVSRSCCVENCSNNTKSQPDLNFYILPSEKQRRRRWLQAIVRAETDENGKVLDKAWSPKTLYHYVCSKHFVTG